MFGGSVRQFREALRTKHSTFRSAITVSHYCCFWTTWYKDIKDTFATFVNAILDDFYSFLCLYHILVAALWERSIRHFWAAQPPLFIEVFRSLTTWHFHGFALRTRHSTFRSAITVSHYFCFWTACCQVIKDTFATFVIAVVDDVYNFLCVYRYFSHYMFWGSVRRFRDALRTKHSTFRSAITVNQYCCFWTTWYKDIKDTFATFVNAILVDFYSFLCVYPYFSRYSLRTKHTTFLSSTASFVHRSSSFSHHLTLP